MRRAHSQGMEHLLPIQQQINKAKASRDVGVFEPYWEDGHWVFDRVKAGRTYKPPGNILNIGTTQHKECDQICPSVYENYGNVCAQRLLTGRFSYYKRWRYEYKEFENMCYLEYENCKLITKHWYPIHRGKCPELAVRSTHATNADKILNRVSQWLKTAPYM